MADDDPPGDDEGAVLSPDELDITEDEHVAELDDGRYLISPDEPAEPADIPGDEAGAAPDAATLDAAAVEEWLDDHVRDTGAEFGFHITATFEGAVAHQELYSDDVVTTFESLLTWYAQHVSRETPVEEVLAILLLESNVPVRFPPEIVEAVVEEEGLTAEDSVAALVSAVRESGGVRLPTRR